MAPVIPVGFMVTTQLQFVKKKKRRQYLGSTVKLKFNKTGCVGNFPVYVTLLIISSLIPQRFFVVP